MMTNEQRAELAEILACLDRNDVSLLMQGYLKMVKGMLWCAAHCIDLLDSYLAGDIDGELAEELIQGQIACVTVID